MQLVLASTSPYRKALLERLGLPFHTARPGTDETPRPAESPRTLAQRLAEAKTVSLADHFPRALVIGSDQVATLDDHTPMGKPHTRANACRQLQAASGRALHLYTGLCVLNTITGQRRTSLDCYTLHFRQLTQAQIRDYIERDRPFDCAGSFRAEGLGSALFTQHQGQDPTALIGLPLIALCSHLEAFGQPVLSSAQRSSGPDSTPSH